MHTSTMRLGLPFLGLLLLQGCWTTKEDGDALKRDVEQLKKELANNAQAAKEERLKLQKVMEQATSLLTRNSADVGASVERMQAKLDRMSGDVEENKERVKAIEEKFNDFQAKVDVKLEGLSGQSQGNTNAPVPEDKDALFKQAQEKFAAGDHQETRRLLRHFTTRYGDDKRMDEAQLMLGESYFAEEKYAPAIVEYKKLVEQYKDSPKVSDALFKIGMCFYQLKFCSDAELFLSQMLKVSPNHSQAARAKKVLGLIKQYRKNRNICRP